MFARASNALPEEVSRWFRPNETIRASLPCRVSAGGSHLTKGWAVVVKTKEGGEWDAAVFIVVPQPAPACQAELRLLHLLPVSSSLSLALNQTPPSPSVSHFQLSARPHITLSLWSSAGKAELRVAADDTTRTYALINEVKRLVAIARAAPPNPLRSSWLGYYPLQPPSLDLNDDLPSSSSISESGSVSTLVSPVSNSTALSTPMTALSLMPPAEIREPGISGTPEEDPNPLEQSFSRVAYLREHIFRSENVWSMGQSIKIRVATYNVNDRLPPKDTIELAPMVGQGEEDLLVFGFQEVDLRSHALLISTGNLRADEWRSAILRGLGEKGDEYACIATSQYVGVMMLVFVKKSLESDVSGLETSARGIGLMGFGGNKAGVAVRFQLHDTTLCFVNSHLAAFTNALERRRLDYQSLKSGLSFIPATGHEDVLAVDEFRPEERGRIMNVEDSHATFWIGDLNYRVDGGDEELKGWVRDQEWARVLEKDQLKTDISSGKSFAGYQEGEIAFPPTYKYIHGSSTLDDRRAPAYTDRILWKIPPASRSQTPGTGPPHNNPIPGSFPIAEATASLNPIHKPVDLPSPKPPAKMVQCDRYSSHEILWSDHRPVSATFTTQVRVVDPDKRKQAVNEARRKLERLEELWRPALQIERTEVDFGPMKYRQQSVQEIRIENTGRVPASFSFREPGSDKSISKPYFWVLPSAATVDPSQSLNLRIVAFAHNDHARDLTTGSDMNDVLVLQVQDGKDTFITLSATFLPTLIGLPLDRLPTLSTKIRDLPLVERKTLSRARPRPRHRMTEDGAPPTPEKSMPVEEVSGASAKPAREVWRLLEYLMEKGQGAEGLWFTDGRIEDDHEVLEVIEAVGTGTDFPSTPSSARSVSLALLHTLQNLPEPVIPRQWHQFCLKAITRDEAFACLEGVQGIHTNVLIGLMSVARLCSASPLAEDATSSDKEAAAVEQTISTDLISILASTVFGTDPTMGMTSSETTEGRRRFVRLLLEG